MYKLIKNTRGKINSVQYQVGDVLYSIPFDQANTDYQAFKKDINEGAELLDAEGNVMTDAQAFVKELP